MFGQVFSDCALMPHHCCTCLSLLCSTTLLPYKPLLQAWTSIMGYYVDKRRHFESEIKKYSDPPSDALLPELPPHARCAAQL